MKKVKTYRAIKGVEMADDHVYAIDLGRQYAVLYSEEILRTKDEALKYSEHAYSTGYGKYSGLQIWQMPQKITRQIRRILGDKYTCLCYIWG
jgi:hypothetical protein